MGLVFDVQRCALHDGPGIRTTVFLKGCPLSCLFCHNPESVAARPELSYRADLCQGCLSCIAVCPTGAQAMDDRGRHVLHRERCEACGRCVEACAHGALARIGREMGVGEIVDMLERDRAYFERSGGGLTVSGGEPMMQPDFTIDLLRAAKHAHLHTCLDTSGYGRSADYERALECVDIFLYDYKATGRDAHTRLTGRAPDRILDNLDLLIHAGASIVLRCPLVPGVNDDESHFEAIADIARRCPRLRVEIMPYHAMGRDKAERVGRKNRLYHLPSVDDRTREIWSSRLRDLGCYGVRSIARHSM